MGVTPPGLPPPLQLDADPLAVDGAGAAVPGDALHAHHRDVAAQAPEALDQHHVDASPRGGQRRGQTPGTTPDHQYVSVGDGGDLPSALRHRPGADWPHTAILTISGKRFRVSIES